MRKLIVTTEYRCKAEDWMFTREYNQLPLDIKSIIEGQQGLPCEGGGRPGDWCTWCYWDGGSEELDMEWRNEL